MNFCKIHSPRPYSWQKSERDISRLGKQGRGINVGLGRTWTGRGAGGAIGVAGHCRRFVKSLPSEMLKTGGPPAVAFCCFLHLWRTGDICDWLVISNSLLLGDFQSVTVPSGLSFKMCLMLAKVAMRKPNSMHHSDSPYIHCLIAKCDVVLSIGINITVHASTCRLGFCTFSFFTEQLNVCNFFNVRLIYYGNFLPLKNHRLDQLWLCQKAHIHTLLILFSSLHSLCHDYCSLYLHHLPSHSV